MKRPTLEPLLRWTKAHTPLGMDSKRELTWSALCLGGGTVYALLYFPRLLHTIDMLYYTYPDGRRVLHEGAMMPDLIQLAAPFLRLYVIIIIAMAFVALRFYLAHFQQSRSIYTMRRLPDGCELWRRVLSLPAATAAIAMALCAILLPLYYLAYIKLTPPQCIPPDQLARLAEKLLGGF